MDNRHILLKVVGLLILQTTQTVYCLKIKGLESPHMSLKPLVTKVLRHIVRTFVKIIV